MRGFSPCRHSITHKREAGLRLPPLDKSTFCHSFFSMTEGAFLWLFSGFAFMPGESVCFFAVYALRMRRLRAAAHNPAASRVRHHASAASAPPVVGTSGAAGLVSPPYGT